MQATNTLQVPEADSTSLLFLFSDVGSQPQAHDLLLPLNAWVTGVCHCTWQGSISFLFTCCLLLCVYVHIHVCVGVHMGMHVHVCVHECGDQRLVLTVPYFILLRESLTEPGV